jgi:dihydroflavonol-4-reductase
LNLVTGATGILGSHVALELLKREQPVTAGRRQGSDIAKTEKLFAYYGASDQFAKIRWVDADVTDIFSVEEALEGVTAVYHCAGLVSFSAADRGRLFRLNEQGTRNVVNACLHRGVKQLCHASSLATIRNQDVAGPLTEQIFWKSTGRESDYSISKYNAEREAWRGLEEGLDVVIVNPGVILAPGFWDQSSSRLFSRCHEGNRFYTSGMAAYVGAPDVAQVMVALMERKMFGERYIVIEGNYSYREIFTRIQTRFGKKPPSVEVPPALLRAGQRVSSLLSFFRNRPPEVTRSMVRSLLNRQTYSNGKIRNALQHEFRPVPLLIDEICKAYMDERQTVK